MTHSHGVLIAIATVACAVLTGCSGETSSAGASRLAVDAEVARVDTTLQALEARTLPEGLGPLLKSHRRDVETARNTTDPNAKMWHLRDPFVGVETIRYLLGHEKAGKELTEFEMLWNSEKQRFGTQAKRADGSHLQRALAAAARNRAEKLFRASLAYGRATSPGNGLYYLAEAEGNRRFGEFVASLPSDSRKERPLQTPALRSAMGRVETQTLAEFGRDPSGRTTIPVSALLKEARELLDGGQLEAAALTLLDARLELSRRTGTKQAAVPPVQQSPRETIAALFVAIAAEDPEAADDVSRDVIPLYESLLAETAHPAAAAGPVTITLARWPYT